MTNCCEKCQKKGKDYYEGLKVGRGVKENITKLKIRAYDEGGANMAREILEMIEGMKGTPRMRGSANQYGYTYALDDLKAAITGLLEK